MTDPVDPQVDSLADGPADPFDEPLSLDRLLPPGDLDDLAQTLARAHGCGVAIIDARDHLLAAAEVAGAAAQRAPIDYHGERLGWIELDGGTTGAASAAASMCELILHHAHARRLASVAHEATANMTYADLAQKNKSLEAAVARLRDADRVKSNFLATMSHELRTPLTSVIGYSEMLLEGLAGPLGEDQRDYVSTILGKADQLLQLITSVLDMSRVDAHRPPIDQLEVPLLEVVDSVVASFAPQATKHNIRLESSAQYPVRALGDRRQIRQVLWNLVSNAVKFTADGGHIAVAIKIGPLVPGGIGTRPDHRLAAHLEVTDTGIGIPREQLPNIFEPFFQIDSSSTREYGGSGLGLALAKAYVEAHGGRIWVDSTLGRGSTFVASFPAVAHDVRAALSSVRR